ncbi:Uncharacterized protein APZ42_005576 [Daphnia magna]|uniref:Uncharacterized protein n=1 Tax=Daphnia magna TaxID=35525 RepID=A0A162D4W3_9CRUS|nr:Uncharacterized protein APZ42_005576 [Daphnia magna]
MFCVHCPCLTNRFIPFFFCVGKRLSNKFHKTSQYHLFPVFYFSVKRFYVSNFLYTSRKTTCFMLDRGCHLFFDVNVEKP